MFIPRIGKNKYKINKAIDYDEGCYLTTKLGVINYLLIVSIDFIHV
jgi:hypothetical protein